MLNQHLFSFFPWDLLSCPFYSWQKSLAVHIMARLIIGIIGKYWDGIISIGINSKQSKLNTIQSVQYKSLKIFQYLIFHVAYLFILFPYCSMSMYADRWHRKYDLWYQVYSSCQMCMCGQILNNKDCGNLKHHMLI